MRRVWFAIGGALGFALIFALLYPALWPQQAHSRNDPVGYWIGSIGIPAVAVAGYALGAWLERRRTPASEDETPRPL